MNLKQRAVAAVIGGAFAFPPVPSAVAFPVPMPSKPATPVAAEEKQGKEKTPEQRFKEIEAKLDRLTEMLEGRKDDMGIRSLVDPGLLAEVKDLKNQVQDLKSEVGRLKSSTSLRPSTTPDAAAGKGTVRIVNDYPVEITMVVNDTSYRVAPNKKLDVPVSAGEFTYQLLNAGANLTPTRSPIKEKEVVTLRIK